MAVTRVADAVAAHALGLPDAWQDFPWEGDLVTESYRAVAPKRYRTDFSR